MGIYIIHGFIIISILICSLADVSIKYYGCFSFFKSTIHFQNDTHMSGQLCMDFCLHNNYTWGAISLKSLCNCNSDRAYIKLNDSICSHKCPGNPQESCGSNGIFTSSMWGLNIDTTNTDTSDSEDGIGSGVDSYVVIGGAIGAIVVAIVIAVVLLYYYRKRKDSSSAGGYIDDKTEQVKGNEIQLA